MTNSSMPARKDWMRRSAGPKRTPFKASTATPGKSKGSSGFVAVPPAVKDILRARNESRCEVGIMCVGRAYGENLDPAHREGKGSGGTGKAWSNLASNLLWACRRCHDEIDNGSPKDAERYGFKVRAGVARPWEIPVKHYEHGWVLLDDAGRHRPAPAESYERPDGLLPVVGVSERDLDTQGPGFVEAMTRYKHINCPGWSPPREGVFTCGCGSEPFVLLVIA